MGVPSEKGKGRLLEDWVWEHFANSWGSVWSWRGSLAVELTTRKIVLRCDINCGSLAINKLLKGVHFYSNWINLL